MFANDWNLETALEVEREEGIEKGREEILSLLSKGYTLEAIKEELARPVVSS